MITNQADKLYVVYNSEAVSLFYKYNVHFTCKL